MQYNDGTVEVTSGREVGSWEIWLESMSAVSHPAASSCFRLTGFSLLVDFRYASHAERPKHRRPADARSA
jgi:hypothetical protein